MKVYDNYVVVLPADQAIRVSNTLAKIGLALEGLTIVIPEGDDELLRITPQDIREAHRTLLDALQENWLGCGAHELGPRP